ncbi:MAG: phosphotransacetylase family protein [Candidatus Helarchaeota archaeon]
MKKILLASRGQFSGKSALAIGLGLALTEKGHKVGYFKPIGRKFQFGEGKTADFDAQVISKVLNLKESPEDLCPILLDRDFVLRDINDGKRKEILEKIKTSFDTVSKNHDIMIIEGQRRNYDLSSLELSNPIISKELDAKGLLMTSGEAYNLIDDIFLSKEHFKKDDAELVGVVFNNVASYAVPLIKEEFIPVVKKRIEMETIGVIPINTKLISPMVKEVYARTGGQLLEKVSDEKMRRLCEHVLIGAMSPEHAFKYFRRTNNNLIITGGDRPDIIIGALELPNTSCVILTGNIQPPNMVLTKAHEKEIPLILVPHDTQGTSELVRHTTGYVSAENKEKIKFAKETIEKHLDLKKLLDIF